MALWRIRFRMARTRTGSPGAGFAGTLDLLQERLRVGAAVSSVTFRFARRVVSPATSSNTPIQPEKEKKTYQSSLVKYNLEIVRF